MTRYLNMEYLQFLVLFTVFLVEQSAAAGPGFGCNDTFLLQELHKCEKTMLESLMNNSSSSCRDEISRLQDCSRRLVVDTCYSSLYAVYPKLKPAIEQVMDITLKQFNSAQFYCSEDKTSINWNSLPTAIKDALPCHRRFFDESLDCAEKFRVRFVKNKRDPNLCSLYTQSKRCSYELSLRYCTNSTVLAINKLNPFCPRGIDAEPRVVKPKYKGHTCMAYICVSSSAGPVTPCAPPREMECLGEPDAGLLPDGCATARLEMKYSNGVVITEEFRNCTYTYRCDPIDFCYRANRTGIVTQCHLDCCKGNLCNRDDKDSVDPSVSPTNQAKLASGNPISEAPIITGAGLGLSTALPLPTVTTARAGESTAKPSTLHTTHRSTKPELSTKTTDGKPTEPKSTKRSFQTKPTIEHLTSVTHQSSFSTKKTPTTKFRSRPSKLVTKSVRSSTLRPLLTDVLSTRKSLHPTSSSPTSSFRRTTKRQSTQEQVTHAVPTDAPLSCFSYACTKSPLGPLAPCSPPKPVTCEGLPGLPLTHDRCMTARISVEIQPGMVVHQELSNCTFSFQCQPYIFCNGVASVGKVLSCDLQCCEGDLCNKEVPATTTSPPVTTMPVGTRAAPKTQGPEITERTSSPLPNEKPIKCISYACAKTAQGPQLPCPPPEEIDCVKIPNSPIAPDGCMTTRLSMEVAPGAIVHQELRNCSYSYQCVPELFCNAANRTGMMKTCEMKCCKGSLCNKDVLQTTTQVPATARENFTKTHWSQQHVPSTPSSPQGSHTTRPAGRPLKCFSYICSKSSVIPSPPCAPPQEVTCLTNGLGPYFSHDVCMTMRVWMEVPPGISIYQEIRNCSYSRQCSQSLACKAVNQSGLIDTCQLECCKDDMCNGKGFSTTERSITTQATRTTVLSATHEPTAVTTVPSSTQGTHATGPDATQETGTGTSTAQEIHTTRPTFTQGTQTTEPFITQETQTTTAHTTPHTTKQSTAQEPQTTKPITTQESQATGPVTTQEPQTTSPVATNEVQTTRLSTSQESHTAIPSTTQETQTTPIRTQETAGLSTATQMSQTAKPTSETRTTITKTTQESRTTRTSTTQGSQTTRSTVTHKPPTTGIKQATRSTSTKPTEKSQVTQQSTIHMTATATPSGCLKPKPRRWVKVTPSWITQHRRHGVKVSYRWANGGLKIAAMVTSYGCRKWPGSGLTTFIRGNWTRIMYTQEFRGSASCWKIFGNGRHKRTKKKFASSGIEPFDRDKGDIIFNELNMGGQKANAFTGSSKACRSSHTNFWHRMNGEGLRRATVMLRRTPGAKDAGIHTATSCGTPSYTIKDIFVYV